MIDLTERVNGTPFKNSTYRFMATDNKDAKRDFYYTPEQITNWRYSSNPDSVSSMVNFVHDISHIIDLYQRGETAKLLKRDFGWKLVDINSKRSDAAIMTELRTITIQELLCQSILGTEPLEDAHGFWRERLRHVRTNPEFLRGRGAFSACVDELTRKSERTGVDGYLKVWKAACGFVKQYRESEEIRYV